MLESAASREDEQKAQLLPLPESLQVSNQLSIAEPPPLPLIAPSTPPLPVVPSTSPPRIRTERKTRVLPPLPSAPIKAEPTDDIHIYRIEQLQVMNAKQWKQYVLLVLLWVAVNLYFWYWWLQAGNIGNPVLFTLLSLTFFYEGTLLPSFYTFFVSWMRRPRWIDANQAEQAGILKRVAVISLTVPGSESLEIVKRQMLAMKNIRYPHESWILVDKVHSPEIEAFAKSLGIFYFSRHDVATWGQEQVDAWNQSQPPFKTKTKAGNVNSWIDAYGHQYSHFTQLDIDHIPIPSYLERVLGFFLDPKVKWVQAPSVYGNLGDWTARGSAEQELVLQGPLQMGFFGFCRTPFIIGSHCTYDMAAIREIGGFGPTRAEDHLDTVFLAAQGYQGVFLPEVIAVGDGPDNFETYVAQQFAWAFSMIQVLFTFTPKRIKYYTPRQTIQFLFVQTWYTFWSTAMLMLFTLPLITLFTNTPIARVSYWQFLLHSLPIGVTGFIIWLWSHSWYFPKNLDLSWRGILLHIARWPIVLSAFIQVILGVKKPYMITKKGLQQGIKKPFSLAPFYPYFFLIGLSLGACWFYLAAVGQSDSQGYLLFALQGTVALLLPFIAALLKDMKDMLEGGIHFIHCLRLHLKPLLLLTGILVAFFWTVSLTIGDIYVALSITK
jgi:cellulose synthase (UDP-forming)